MKILELNTWTTADVILYLIRLHAPRHTKSFWEEVYLPCLRDGDGSLMQQRVGGWCRRWKIGLDRRSCASKLLFYAFDSYCEGMRTASDAEPGGGPVHSGNAGCSDAPF